MALGSGSGCLRSGWSCCDQCYSASGYVQKIKLEKGELVQSGLEDERRMRVAFETARLLESKSAGRRRCRKNGNYRRRTVDAVVEQANMEVKWDMLV